ncbi:unnamed protein product [Diamesa serratosioi]
MRSEGQNDHNDWLLKVETGNNPPIPGISSSDTIEIPPQIIAKEDLIGLIFGNQIDNMSVGDLAKRVIKAPTNEQTLQMNHATEIIQLKNDIKSHCKNPTEAQSATTTTQNPVEVQRIIINKLEQELVETKELQHLKKELSDTKLEQQDLMKKNAIEMEKMNANLAKVQQELSAAKIGQQKEHDKMIKLEQKNVELNMDISITFTAHQLQQEDMTKLNKTITKLEEEVNAAKIERQENVKLSNALTTENDAMKELNINLEKEILELKKDLLESRTAHNKDRLDWEEKTRELNDRLTTCEVNSNDVKLIEILKKITDLEQFGKTKFTNLERIGHIPAQLLSFFNGLRLLAAYNQLNRYGITILQEFPSLNK